jgi:hypothetical protein
MREFHSPYLAMGNNPINLIDPTGGQTDGPEPPVLVGYGPTTEVCGNCPPPRDPYGLLGNANGGYRASPYSNIDVKKPLNGKPRSAKEIAAYKQALLNQDLNGIKSYQEKQSQRQNVTTATLAAVVGAVDQTYGAWQEGQNFTTYTTTKGKEAMIFKNGKVRSPQAAKQLSWNNTIKTGGLGLNIISTGLGYANLYDQYNSTGTMDKLDATEVGVGTVGTVANGMSYFGWGGAAAGTIGTASGVIVLGIMEGRMMYQFYNGMQDLEWQRNITNDPGEMQWNQWQNDNGIMNEGDLYGGN